VSKKIFGVSLNIGIKKMTLSHLLVFVGLFSAQAEVVMLTKLKL